MKRKNITTYVLTTIISAFLLGFWYYLRFNWADNVFDLVISVAWWAMTAIAIITIVRVERKRREHIRTIYVSERSGFNSEVGLFPFDDHTHPVDAIDKVLKDLTYGFEKVDFPHEKEFFPHCHIRTTRYGSDTWEGEVFMVRTEKEEKFETREELSRILVHT
ncbi:MAG: hypothetical protein FWG23_04705 [Eggerthellaceae bacterium]|jgi:hypothetical protein|nr:hypothetical protein [Eggerthellaceae bacterium]MDR2715950.1 hypothetical protein [Coriobacteriaceae bacterium]